MTTDQPVAEVSPPPAYIVGSEHLDRLLAIEVIDRLARKLGGASHDRDESTARAALAGMLGLTAKLIGFHPYDPVTAAVNAVAAVWVAAPDHLTPDAHAALLEPLGVVADAVQTRYCTDVKNLRVSDWIASRARDIVALTLRDAR